MISPGMRLLRAIVAVVSASKDISTPQLIELHQALAEALEEDLKAMMCDELGALLSLEQISALVDHARSKAPAEEKK